MNINTKLEMLASADNLRRSFFKWQCRVRQIAMRESQGRPDASITPEILLGPEDIPLGQIITLMHKLPRYSATAELKHIAKKTFDPSQRREQAIRFLSSNYYQKADEFADILTASFAPDSKGAVQIYEHGSCKAIFEAYSQRFVVKCKVWKLSDKNPYYESTIAHNLLFNPDLKPGTIVIGFEPVWTQSLSSN